MARLAKKVALITGGNSGIGRATAKLFVAEGAKVFITGRRKSELDSTVSEIGGDIVGIQGDVSVLDDLDRIYSKVEADAGRLDVVFANAGVGEFAKLGAISEEHFDRIFATNVKGTVFTVQKALALMQNGGSIVLNASTTSATGTANLSVYGATKAAVRNFARSWILDLKGTGIRINVLSPGPTETPGLIKGLGSTALLAQMAASVPLGRVGEPAEIAHAALFLASDESRFVNGAELFVDGGQAQV
jgi:NAD(P)-dependent dehydrogenase (short-subunit alcohol dehydrogenase family)